MKNTTTSRLYELALGSALLVSLLGLVACNGNKNAATTPGDNSNLGEKAGTLQCADGEFSDAAGKSKIGLKIQTSLYYSMQDQVSTSTLLSGQDVYTKDGSIYYARSVPEGIMVTPGTGNAIKAKTLVPTLSMKFFEKDGKLMLAVGNYQGIDYYNVGTDLTLASSNHFLGAVTDLSAKGDKLCAIADGGKAVVSTGPDASSGGACSAVLYQAADHNAANGKAMEAMHIAAVPEGCLVVTRNMPKLQIRLMDLVDFLRSLVVSIPQRIDLRGIEEKLVLLGNDGTSKDITPTVGNYNKLVVSDLDMTADGAVATYTAFIKDNWDTFSSIDAVAEPLHKIWAGLKLLAEVRAGGLFIVNGEVKKNAELQGTPLTFNLNYPGGTVTINELPHFSLPWFSEGAVDGTRYALKAIAAFSVFDFSGLNDPNVVSLPVEQYTWNNTPGNPLSQPGNPKGIFTQFGFAEKKLFLNGISSKEQINYDYDNSAKVVMNAPPYPASYGALPFLLNIKRFPLGSLRDGYFGINIGGGKLFYKKAEQGAAPSLFAPGAQFAANGITFPGDYKLMGLPVTYESPSDATQDKFVLAYQDAVNKKLIVEALKTDGSAAAISSSEVPVDPAPLIGAFLAPTAVFDDVVVAATNFITPEWRLYAWKIDSNKLDFLGDPSNPTTDHFASGTNAVTMAVKAVGKDTNGVYTVLVSEFGMGGVASKVVRVDFKQDGTTATQVGTHDVAVPDLVSVVTGGGKAFALNKDGDVIPLDLSGGSIAAGGSLGKITEDPAQKVFLPFCGMNGTDIYCTGLFTKTLLGTYKFSTEGKTQTTFKYNRPLVLSFTGSKLVVTYSIDGAGIEAFDVTKAPPAVSVSGGAITTGSGGETAGAGNSAASGGLPAGAKMSGAGCSLSTTTAVSNLGAILMMACLCGAPLAFRLRKSRAQR